MEKILMVCIISILSRLAVADPHRCVSIRPDEDCLACFDTEIKESPSALASAPVTGLPPDRVRKTASSNCYTGPRGGRYRMVNGHKRYDC
jgi:hypothetical protein